MVAVSSHMVSVFQKNLLSAGPGNSRTLGMGRNLLRREILMEGDYHLSGLFETGISQGTCFNGLFEVS